MNRIVIDSSRDRMGRVRDRFGVIGPLVTGRRVLDLGCVNHDVREEVARPDWLHRFIADRARSVTGVDSLVEAVIALKLKGYDVVSADVETMNLERRFEVVVAGELIEHLSNVGQFLDRVQAHLTRNGVFIVTTPNAFSLRHMARSILFGVVPTNAEHTALYCPKTLRNILNRHGFRVLQQMYYYDDPDTWRSKVERVLSWPRRSFAPEMLFVCEVNP